MCGKNSKKANVCVGGGDTHGRAGSESRRVPLSDLF